MLRDTFSLLSRAGVCISNANSVCVRAQERMRVGTARQNISKQSDTSFG